MVKKSDPEATPRRDGYLERKGTWGEVTVGSILAAQRRSEAWEVIECAHGDLVREGFTLWFKVREINTGREHAIPPHDKSLSVTFLMKDDEEVPPPPTAPSDADKIWLLIEKLGATVLATKDNVTGEITCPDYDGTMLGPRDHYGREYMEHLRVAHGMDTTGLEALDGIDRIEARIRAHGAAHDRKQPEVGKGGFPHRHVPEFSALGARR